MDKSNEYYRPEWDDRSYGPLTSAKMEFLEFSQTPPKTVLPLKSYDIWVGYYHLGQGHHGSTEPTLLAHVQAKDFKTACFKYELSSILKSIEEQELKGNYISNQDYEWFYNPHTNSNSWLGSYYETEEEAQKSFKR